MRKKRSKYRGGNPYTEGFGMFGAKAFFLLMLSIAFYLLLLFS